MDCTKEASDILVARFNHLQKAVESADLSQVSFPLLGDEARIELVSKRDTLI